MKTRLAYRERKDISSCEDILCVLLTFVEVYQYIFFRTTYNPKISIIAYDYEKNENFTFIIETKYSHNLMRTIAVEYQRLMSEYDFLKNVESILEVSLTAKGTRGYKEQLIYVNPNIPAL